MEQSSQMSAEQSLKLINETLRDSRLVITKKNGKSFHSLGRYSHADRPCRVLPLEVKR